MDYLSDTAGRLPLYRILHKVYSALLNVQYSYYTIHITLRNAKA